MCFAASRHIERTRVLVYVIDITAVEVKHDKYSESLRAPRQLSMLRAELGAYDPDLLTKPSIVAANKIDMMDARSEADLRALRRATHWPVVEISGLRSLGTDELAALLRRLCNDAEGADAKHTEGDGLFDEERR